MSKKTVLFVSEETRQRVNIIKAKAGYKTQDEVIKAALYALEAARERKAETNES